MAGNSKSDIFEKYDLTEYGFLTMTAIPKLSESFDEWEQVVAHLPELNKNHLTRAAINRLETFEWSQLKDPWQWKRAYVVLTLLTNSYVFSESPPATKIPSKLAVPLVEVSIHLGINPILTHAAVDLYNWDIIDPAKPFGLDNLKSVSLMTGTRSEEWFYLIMVAIEKVGGNIISNILDIMDDIQRNHHGGIVVALQEINSSLGKCCDIIKRMKENCKPEIFWNNLRPFLAGWKNNDNLPNGMIYEDVTPRPLEFFGGSAAQSSLFQVIDAVFGIKHDSEYFNEILDYMQKKHRECIKFVEKNVKLGEYIKDANLDALNKCYNDCIKTVEKFRKLHYGLVYTYIIKMVKKEKGETLTEENEENTESSEKGTGGTDLRSFLNQSIEDTKDSQLGS